MFNENNFKKIKNIVQEFFEKMGFETEIKIGPQKDLTVPISLEAEEPQVLIGENGRTLAEIQHLLKRIIKRKITSAQDLSKEPFYVDLDINGYKKKKIEYLRETAMSLADEVVLSKKEKMLEPMLSYERRIVHLELAKRGDVITESVGQEPERRVIIKPCS